MQVLSVISVNGLQVVVLAKGVIQPSICCVRDQQAVSSSTLYLIVLLDI